MAVVFDSVGFSAELDSLKSKVGDKLKSELKTAVTEESKSQLDGKNPNDAQAYTNFYNRVNPTSNFKKNIIPEDVYKAIMLEAAVRDKTISNGFNIGNLDGKTVSAISSWFQGIFGKKTMTVSNYTVTMQSNYSAQVKFPNGKVYSVTWTLDDTAKKALKAYIADLKTYLSDYRYQIYGEIIKDGLSPLINEFIAEVAEGVDSASEKLINGFHEWALNKAADVTIDKILPKTYKQIKAVGKNYKTFVSKLNDLKTYAKTVKDDSIKNNKKYTVFVTAYNNLGIGNYVDVIANYISYEFLETVGGVFDQSKALITGTNSDNEISASGSYVTIKGGGGNDFISASGQKSRISGDAGNDKIFLKSSQGSISGGAGSDSIIVDGERNTALGGASDDYIALFKGKNTITGGTGNDSIFFVGVGQSVIKYKSGDGNDTIIGYDATDTIKITGNYSMQTSEQDVIITVGNGSIRLVSASGKKININDTVNAIGKPITGGEVTGYTLPSDFDTAKYIKYGTNSDDYISNISDKTMINGGTGNDKIENLGDSATIIGGAGNDSIDNKYGYKTGGSNTSISGDKGDDKIKNTSCDSVTINAGDGNDSIENISGDSVTIDCGAGNDSIYNEGDNVAINGGTGNDSIENGIYYSLCYSVTIDGGKGDDSIRNDGNNVSIDGGADNDYIENEFGDNVTINGGTGNDSIYNSSGSENVTINGGSGKDAIHNYTSNTTINGGDGNDLIYNGYRNDSGSNVIIDSGAGNDYIKNGGYWDENRDRFSSNSRWHGGYEMTINGGAGNDYISNDGSEVTINGGTGDDLISLGEDAEDNLLVYKSGDGNDIIEGFNETSTLSIDNGKTKYYKKTVLNDVVLTVGNDSITLKSAANLDNLNILGKLDKSSPSKNLIFGTNDNDIINKGISDVTISALNGNDSISNYDGNNVSIDGGDGNDSIENDSMYRYAVTSCNNVTINGGTGDDYIENSANNVTIIGGDNNDYIGNGNSDYYNGGSNVEINSGTGNDSIYNRGGNSVTIDCGAGNDSIYNYDGDSVTIDCGAGNDFIRNYYGNNITIDGGANNDSIYNEGDNVAINGGTGNDYIYNDGNSVTIEADTGNDKIYNRGASSVSINGGAGDDSILNGGYLEKNNWNRGGDSLTIDSGIGNDYIYNYGSNVLFKYAKGDGNDIIEGFNSTSTLSIGGGSYSTKKSGDDIIVTVGDGQISLMGAVSLPKVNIKGTKATSTTLTVTDKTKSSVTVGSAAKTINASKRTTAVKISGNSLANSIIGGSGNDTIYGAAGNDSILGNAGNDKLFGDAGNDSLSGGDGTDTLSGGAGNDTLTGGKGNDVFIYSAGNDVITDYTSGDKISLGAAISSTSLKGSDATFTIGKNTLTVKNGKGKKLSVVTSSGKTQTLIGGALIVSKSATLESWREGGDASALTKAVKITGNAKNNTLLGGSKNDSLYGGKGNDSILGNAGNDKLYGQSGNDILKGGKGNDSLWGGVGNDSLWGGSGNDTFIYSTGEGKDVIYGFENNDLLKITGAFSASYSKSKGEVYFKVDTTSKAITLMDFSVTNFNINGTNYKINGSKLVKR